MNKKLRKWISGMLAAAMISASLSGMVRTDAFAAWTGTVAVSALNLRSGATTSSGVLGVLSQGTKVNISEKKGDWYKVTVTVGGRNMNGYVHSDYVNAQNGSASSGSTVSGTASAGTVNVDALNVRNGASMTSSVIGCLSMGTKVTIKEKNGDWYKISVVVNGRTVNGYSFASYITPGSAGGSSSANSGNNGGNDSSSSSVSGTGYVNTAVLNVRSGPSTSTKRIGCIYKDNQVKITGETNGWYKITAGSLSGYASAQYITKASGSGSGSGSSGSGTSSGTGSGTQMNGTGKVNVYGLNVRAFPSTASSIISCISENTVVSIREKSGDWYKITVTSNGKSVTGYVFAQYITVTSSGGQTGSGSGSSTGSGGQTGSGGSTTASNKTGKVNTAVLNFRKGPGTGYARIGYLYENNIVTIMEESNGWYKVSVTSNGKNMTGYVSAEYITVSGSGSTGGSSTGGSGSTGGSSTGGSGSTGGSSSSGSFEQMIAGFPESYRPALRSLHEKHANWIFKPVQTGLDWNAVVSAESVFRSNTVDIYSFDSSTNFGLLSTDTGAYDWKTDTYTLCDGRTWYSASSDLIKYYLDPRNFLDEKYIFSFESLAYDPAQKQSVVESILSGSFMSGTYTEKDPSTGKTYTKSYAETFMEAGKQAGASPYFLAGRSLTEVGYQGSGSVSGNYGTLKGYYNFFNIGAYDGVDAVANGLRFAKQSSGYDRPWNTRYKSITGGSKYIAQNYISVGQNTPYFQKFNVVYKNALYTHQYMTAVHGATSQAASVYNSYKKYGILDEAIVFYIPVYQNMPSSPCTKPNAGNPNAYLKSLALSSGRVALTPSFQYNVTDYTVVVKHDVSSVTVSAQAVSRFAKGISGTGTYNLVAGKNNIIKVTCTAGNGTQKTYTIKIYRQ